MQTSLPITDLAKRPENALEERSAPLTTVIADAVRQGVSPDVLEKLIDLQERVERNEAAKVFAANLAAFQAKCPQIQKTRKINLGGGEGPLYASLDDIMRVIGPLQHEFGLSVTFSASMTDGGQLRAMCNVRCGSHVESSECTIPVPASMKVNATQQMGAALSYAKRYALCAALNIVVTDEDSDGSGLEGELISDKQAEELLALIKKVGRTVDAFCGWANVTSLNECTVGKYREFKSMVRSKQK